MKKFTRKLTALFLSLVLVIGLLPTNAFAADVDASEDKAYFTDSVTGDSVSMEVVTPRADIRTRNMSSSATVTRIERNGEFYEYIYVDFESDVLLHEYADGSTKTKALSDMVTITAIDTTLETSGTSSIIGSVDIPYASVQSTDYVWDEPLGIDANGVQLPLTGASTYSGYKAMGSRAGDLSPSTIGCLQRKDSGLIDTVEYDEFDFAANTTEEEAANIIRAFYISKGKILALKVVLSILKVVVVWTVALTLEISLLQYRWEYRVRYGSNYGQIMGSYYRDISYWKCCSRSSGAVRYEEASSSYMYGYLQDNVSMINAAINSYLGLV